MNDEDLLKVMLTKHKLKQFTKKGEKYIQYGEIIFKYDLLAVKKEKIYIHYKSVVTAIVQ
ncbi:MAG: hypothetical protein JXM74_10380 [Fusobacteriaceae bacterium]|nr:hypothetical protein [Fusobacteriaceae bacterium]MBN2839148.1 hypothetical protein [Fusobacteriaceae bacterium]